MRLKRLELSGFKSFVDPTKIELGHGINAIIGPNGCGKSNIVDAIRWVLGEHSARHLRGGVMDDLIFQGSDTRPPVGICDVELTFAVQRGKLPSPYHDMDEIRIRRRLIREGGSDAFINGKMVRMKDIVDLFLDTGVSTRAYAIVEQGSIARMITAKPEERRILLEEAAGVVKYRTRRKEAERKMDSTQQNLERIEDLLEEIRSQCRSLKQQASRAERFKAMQDEFEHAQAKALAIRYQKQQHKLDAFQGELTHAQRLLEEQQAAQTHSERLLIQTRRATLAHDEEVQSTQEQLRQHEQQRSQLQQQAERIAGEQRLLTERQQTLQQRISETTLRQQQLCQDVINIEAQLHQQNNSDLQQQHQDAEQQLSTMQEKLQQARQARDSAFSRYEQLRSQFNELEQRSKQVASNLQRLLDKLAHAQLQIEQLHQQQTNHAQSVIQSKEKQQLAHDKQMASEAAVQAAQHTLDTCREQQKQALEQRNLAEQALRALRGEIRELQAQLQQHNISDDVRQQLEQQGGIWLDQVLTVPEGLEMAVAAAIRGQESAFVLPSHADVDAWKLILQSVQKAPVTIYYAKPTQSTLTNMSLSSALGIQSEHPLYAALSHIQLCDDIFSTTIPKYGCLVSRDGWRLESDGWLTPPANNKTARRLAQTRRLAECDKHVQSLETAMLQAEEAVTRAEKNLTQAQQQWQVAHLATTQAQSDLQANIAHLERQHEALNSIQTRQQQWQHDVLDIEHDIQHWQQQRDSIQQWDQQALIDAEKKLQEQTQAQQQCEQQWQHARSSLAHTEQALALFKQTVSSLQRDAHRMQQEIQQLTQRADVDEKQLQETIIQIQACQNHHDLDLQLSAAHEQVEAAHRQLNELRNQGHALQQKLRQHEQGEQASRKAVQQADEARQHIEIRHASEQARLQDLCDDITQRMQCTVEQLLNKHAAHKNSTENLNTPADMEHCLQHARELEDRLNRFGPVNLLAIEEFQQANEREQFLTAQVTDLEASLNTLRDTIGRIDRTTRQRFRETFEQTNAYFKQTFPRLFGGGHAELRLDSDDVLTAGVEVIAQPPGKRLQDVTLLSGGEKALTAVALVFSIFRINPAPFCILDEVDAPLDDANVARFSDMITEFCDDVQFLAISHNKITMQKANRLIGVSMPEPGVSKIVSVDIESIPH